MGSLHEGAQQMSSELYASGRTVLSSAQGSGHGWNAV